MVVSTRVDNMVEMVVVMVAEVAVEEAVEVVTDDADTAIRWIRLQLTMRILQSKRFMVSTKTSATVEYGCDETIVAKAKWWLF
uniref:Uncharacterized protein n=1 Tax=Physcomitrium patens TaxID=3218 RepID=A0A2K1IXH8_PHYPA|nr:hypothetical protein PHYPA_023793 [Physcomitrium patens]PNR33978.1 hypothetical protein PHYPA_023794 [Physcomitrium patens]